VTEEYQEAFLALLEPVYPRLARYSLAITKDRMEAEDLTSETVLRALESYDTLNDPTKFASFLFTIATRLNKRKRFRERMRMKYDERLAIRIADNSAGPDNAAEIRIVMDALERLPQKVRVTVMLFEIADLSLEEIREVQSGTLSGVKSRLRRGRKLLQEMLEVGEGYEGAKGSESSFTTPMRVQMIREYVG